MARPRFFVVETHGWAIRPNSGSYGGGSNRRPPIVFTVLDRAVGHRIVAEFPPSDGHGAALPLPKRRAKADQLAARLNAETLAAEAAA